MLKYVRRTWFDLNRLCLVFIFRTERLYGTLVLDKNVESRSRAITIAAVRRSSESLVISNVNVNSRRMYNQNGFRLSRTVALDCNWAISKFNTVSFYSLSLCEIMIDLRIIIIPLKILSVNKRLYSLLDCPGVTRKP